MSADGSFADPPRTDATSLHGVTHTGIPPRTNPHCRDCPPEKK